MKFDGFLLAMLVAVGLALLWPQWGTAEGPLHLGVVAQLGIAVIFFAHGLLLSPQSMRSGAAKWRVHLLIQLTTFVVFPIIGGVLYWSTRGLLTDELRLGFFLLCAMSSTITSSVAMTVIARGDVVSAVFNASLSSLLGIVLTPLLMQLITTGSQGSLPLGDTILGIVMVLAVPFAVGQLSRPLLLQRVLPHQGLINKLDRGVIILIVYSSFCDSTASGIWARFSLQQLLTTTLLALLLLIGMLSLTQYAARLLGFSREEQITAMFCGSKKSIASGAPMARIMFAAHPGVGLIMLPLMLYHQLQLLVCTLLAQRYAQRPNLPLDMHE
jgi:solute carrier family 10 (sodium/bile acid cotransporter), member 7